MPIISQAVNLLDVAKRRDPDGKIATLVEVLHRTNSFVANMPFIEANQETKHLTTIRTGELPRAIWRKYNQGVPPAKSSSVQVEETMGMLEARSHVDEKLVKINADPAAFRLSESIAFVEGISQQVEDALFYASPAENDPFTGLQPRYDYTDGATGDFVIDAGGADGASTSIYVMVLGEQTVHGIYPRGSVAGIQHEDLGLGDVLDANQNPFRAYRDLWRWDVGMCVRDHRAVVRIANVGAADLLGAGLSTGGTQAATAKTNVLRAVIEAKYRIPAAVRGRGRLVAFMNPRCMTAFQLMGLEKSQNAMGLMQGQKQAAISWDGIDFIETDALRNDEAKVVAM